MSAPSNFPANLQASFPPGTSVEEARAYYRRANGSIPVAVEMCQADLRRGLRPHQSSAPSNQYFVGGGSSSGQAVLAPPAPPVPANPDSLIENVFQRARENGARDATAEYTRGGPVAFAGSGRRLGHLEGPSPVMQPLRRLEKTIRITFYQNGFQIEDGPLRSLTDEKGIIFCESINKGYIPRELVEEFGDVSLSVNLVDRREEDFTPPAAPRYTAFAGSGRTLAAAQQSASPSRNEVVPLDVAAARATAEAHEVVVDETEEKCPIVIMNLLGKRCEVMVNPRTHTIRDVRALASATQGFPRLPLDSFDLMVRDLPPRLLCDDSATVDAAKCRNATILMKKK